MQLDPNVRPIIFVGDLHGSIDFFRKLQRAFGGTHDFILVGDLLDSFVEPIPNQVALVKDVLTMVKEERGICLTGNHDLNYIHRGDRRVACSGYKPATQVALLDSLDDMRKLLLPFCFFAKDSLLVSHAGLTGPLYEDMDAGAGEFEWKLTGWARDLDSPFYQVGYARGGSEPYGGLTWCDWHKEFVPIEGLTQVFGHSHYEGVTMNFKEGRVAFDDGTPSNIRCDHETMTNFNVDCLYPDDGKHWDVLEWWGGKDFKPLRVVMP